MDVLGQDAKNRASLDVQERSIRRARKGIMDEAVIGGVEAIGPRKVEALPTTTNDDEALAILVHQKFKAAPAHSLSCCCNIFFISSLKLKCCE